eukprot:g1588.t1
MKALVSLVLIHITGFLLWVKSIQCAQLYSSKCQTAEFFCALVNEGSSWKFSDPKRVKVRFYTLSETTTNLPTEFSALDREIAANRINTKQEICPRGYYCPTENRAGILVPLGIKVPCPAGMWGELEGATTQQETCKPCSSGYYCQAGSTTPIEHPCSSPTSYCPEGSSSPTNVRSGYFALLADPNSQGYDKRYNGEGKCRAGTYCENGIQHLCPIGHYGILEGETSPECSGLCSQGYFCDRLGETSPTPVGKKCGGNQYFCPAGATKPYKVSVGFYTTGGTADGLTRTEQKICEIGYYCDAQGVRHECPAGRYGSTMRMSDPQCTGICTAGYYCPKASTTATQIPCGRPDVYCPEGASAPTGVRKGYYTLRLGQSAQISTVEISHPASFIGREFQSFRTEDLHLTTRTEEKECEEGYYCSGGLRYQCKGGYYGNAKGLWQDTCSGVCSAGYFCPSGSTSATQYICGGYNLYCPEGAASPTQVEFGYYTITDNTLSGMTIRSSRTDCYHNNALCIVVNHGDAISLSELGVVIPTTATRHFNHETHVGGETVRQRQILCEEGHYCVNGRRYECLPGTFGNKVGETSSTCSGICEADFACPSASTSPTQVACTSPTHFAPAGSGGCTPVLNGYYIQVGEDRNDFPWMCKADVEKGRSVESLPFQFIESTEHNSFTTPIIDANFNNTLDPIWGNPAIWGNIRHEAIGITVNYQTPMMATSFGSVELERGKQFICPKGYYCQGGVRKICHSGRYGAVERQTSSDCSGYCDWGHYCPPGSTSPRERECGGVGFFCVRGSSLPTQVAEGYYTIGDMRTEGKYSLEETSSARTISPTQNIEEGNTDPIPYDFETNTTRRWMLRCPAGFYCTGGRRFQCPAGRYGERTGVASAACDGECLAGYFCTPESTNKTQHECGGDLGRRAISFGLYDFESGQETWSGRGVDVAMGYNRSTLTANDLEFNANHSSVVGLTGETHTMDHGVATDIGINVHISRHSNRPSAVYCPKGSPLPSTVSAGHYSVGGNNVTNKTRIDQEKCPKGSYCIAGIVQPCPPGRYGDKVGLTTSDCSGFCPAGFYCPENSVEPTACPDNSYSLGGQSFCMNCPDSHNRGAQRCKTSRKCCNY